MHSTCLSCSRSLGKNEVIERFPVGRRLAFDAARGRLWVVCPSCRRWNLTPLEERWEAIEEAERLFRATPLRVSTGEIGLARLREGLELVRVGAPQRPEIAAWRYGERFSLRRRMQLVTGVSILAGGGLVIAAGAVAGMSVVAAIHIARKTWHYAEHGIPHATVARVRAGREIIRIRRSDLATSTMRVGADGGLAFDLTHSNGNTAVEGETARQVARKLFPGINRRGGTPEEVTHAVARLEHGGTAERFLAATARRGERLTQVMSVEESRTFENPEDVRSASGLLALSTSLGLAIEMALHEEEERRALEGELAELESAWKEAEEVGAIADSLLLPDSIERVLGTLKGRSGARP